LVSLNWHLGLKSEIADWLMKSWVAGLTKQKFYRGKYSQSYQDALLSYIFDNVPPQNIQPYCVEFGFDGSTFHDGGGSNVAKLALEKGWKCLLLDGGHSNPEINLHQHFLTPDNIVDIFKKYGVPTTPEYISIDVDSLDFWLFKALLTTYRPMVYSVEYNAHFPLWAAITVANDPSFSWQGDRLYGASLKALTMLANQNGYSLLWVVPKVDAFFIRNDLIDDGTKNLVLPFAKWGIYTNIKVHPPVRNEERLNCLVGLEMTPDGLEYMVERSEGVIKIGRRFLAGFGDTQTAINYLFAFPTKLKQRLGKLLNKF
jgi:hypothetical protein